MPGSPTMGAGLKKARRKGADIVFVDETGFSFRAKAATTWAPMGQTPILRRISKRRELSTVIGLTLSGKLYKRHFEHPSGGYLGDAAPFAAMHRETDGHYLGSLDGP